MLCRDTVLDLFEWVHAFFFFFLEKLLEMLRGPGLSMSLPLGRMVFIVLLFFHDSILTSSVPDFS